MVFIVIFKPISTQLNGVIPCNCMDLGLDEFKIFKKKSLKFHQIMQQIQLFLITIYN